MNSKELMPKIDELIESKNYDKRFVPVIVTFFSLYNKVYGLDEIELDQMIRNYSENVEKIEYFNIGKNRNITELERKSIILDTSYTEEIDENNIEEYLLQSIQVQSIAIQNNANKIHKDEIGIIKLNETNNLFSKRNPIINRLFEMLFASYCTKETRITKVIETINEQYEKDEENSKNGNYNSLINIYREIKDNFEEIYRLGEQNAGIIKRIYALCLLNFNIKVEDLKDKENNTEYYEIIKQNIKELQKEYNITDEELAKISISSSWKIPTKELEDTIKKKLGIKERLDIFKERKRILPEVRKDKIISILNEQEEDNKVTEEIIEALVNQISLENQYPMEAIPILNEYFKRSAQIYDWNKETLEKKIRNFKSNIKNFERSKRRYEDKEEKNTLAYIDEENKTIKFIRLSSNKRRNLDVVLHELRHVTDKTERDSKIYENGNKNDWETSIYGLDEMCVEGGTQLLIGTKYQDKLHTTLKFEGYQTFQYVLSMISSSIGISEIEFLKMAEKGNIKLKEKIAEIYEDTEVSNELDKIDKILSSKCLLENNASEEEISDALGEIYNVCQDFYELRIKQQSPITEGEKLKVRYEEYKINKNLLQLGQYFKINKRTLGKKAKRDISQIKEKASLTKEGESRILEQIVSKQKDIQWDNKKLQKDLKTFVKKLGRGKNTRTNNNILPSPKPEFTKSLEVRQEHEQQTTIEEVNQKYLNILEDINELE